MSMFCCCSSCPTTRSLVLQRVRPKQSVEQDVTMETSIQQVNVSEPGAAVERGRLTHLLYVFTDSARDGSRLHHLPARHL